ncbi:MAG: response regulator [Gammaproteobacteria bacterium]|nr:response regulator [Gammaproteobacteria bacterium]
MSKDSPVILVVDDNPDNIDISVNTLRTQFRVKAATRGERALKIALSNEPVDLVLLDVVMPEMDGYEVCLALKSNQKTRDIPVVFLSALGGDGDYKKGLEVGASDFIKKPIVPSELLKCVKKFVA